MWSWVQEFVGNWGAWAGIVSAAVLLFARIARMTPNDTDNEVLKVIRKVSRALGVDIPEVDSVGDESSDSQ